MSSIDGCLEGRISVDIDDFLLVNILIRHIEQKLISLLSLIDSSKKKRSTDLMAHLESRIHLEIDNSLLENIIVLKHVDLSFMKAQVKFRIVFEHPSQNK